MASLALRRRSSLRALSRRGPLWLLAGLLLVLLAIALATPLVRSVVHPWPAGASGVEVDTSGTSTTLADGHFTITLPLAVANHTDQVISGVSLWVEAFACPPGATPGHGCQRVVSTAQEVPMHLAPGASGSWSGSIAGVAPADGSVARIAVVRRLAGVENQGDAARAEALAGF